MQLRPLRGRCAAEFVDAGRSTADGRCDVEVGAEPADVDGHAAEDVLQVGLGQAPVATVAEVRASGAASEMVPSIPARALYVLRQESPSTSSMGPVGRSV